MKDDDNDNIAYKIITEGGQQNMNRGSSGGCLSWIFVIIVIVLAASMLGACSGKKNTASYSGSTRHTSSSQSYNNLCWETGCKNVKLTGGNYCYKHTCLQPGCFNRKASGSNYCTKHKTGTAKPSTRATTRTTEKKDPYNISSYSDIDDFYDDWYDDFDGFDDAEMYWDDHH